MSPMTETTTPTPDLAEVAIRAAEDEAKARRAKHVAAQHRYVRKFVGPDLFPQCQYHAGRDEWTIAGVTLRCFTRYFSQCYGPPPPVPYLAYWSFNSFAPLRSLAELGQHIQSERTKARAAEAGKKAPTPAAPTPAPRSWWKRLLS